MIIEIHGTGTHNRGAELMAVAIAERLRKALPTVQIVVPPGFGSFAERAKYGFYATWDGQYRRQRLQGALISMIPAPLRSIRRMVSPASVDFVLDASGFSFSDQWGARSARFLYQKMQAPQRQKQPLILLPQAFGPFEQPEVAQAARRLLTRATRIYPRDDQSLAAVQQLLQRTDLRKYPDFTIAMSGKVAEAIQLPAQCSMIIPNQRMLDKTSFGDEYLAFLRHAITVLQQQQLNPVFLLHDSHEDHQVVQQLGESAAHLPVFRHDDPRVLKWMLGQAELVIGSRFHGLVGALSQGVIAFGIGWSHKYQELFNDFACPQLLIKDVTDHQGFSAQIEQLMQPHQRYAVQSKIGQAAQRLKQQVDQMWEEVLQEIYAAQSI